MSALLRGELLKLRTTRTFVALAGAALAVSLLVVVLTTTIASDFTHDDVRTAMTGDFTAAFILLLGAIGMTGEWRHRTIAGSVLAAPARVRLLAAKTLSYAAAGVLMSLVVTLAVMLTGTLILSSRGEPTLGALDLADVLWRNLAVAALLGALGVGIGGVVRNQMVAVVGMLVLGLVLEPLVVDLASSVGRFGPITSAPNGILALGDGELLAPAVALAVSLAWAGIAFAAAATLLRRRDLV